MKKMLKSVVAVMLCAVLLLSCVSTALAAVPVKDFDMDGYIISAEDKPEYVAFFNDAVNAPVAALNPLSVGIFAFGSSVNISAG